MSIQFRELLKKEGITRQTSLTYTPLQNGVSERVNQTNMEMARNMLHSWNLSSNFPAEEVVTVVYTRNFCPTSAVQTWHPSKCEVVGAIYWPHVHYQMHQICKGTGLSEKQTWIKERKVSIFGYREDTKAYRLMLMDTTKIVRLHDMTFCEDSSIEHPIR